MQEMYMYKLVQAIIASSVCTSLVYVILGYYGNTFDVVIFRQFTIEYVIQLHVVFVDLSGCVQVCMCI